MTNGLSDLQIQQILSIMQGKGTTQSANPKANAASSCLLQTLLRLHQLIIDSGATNHITSSPTLLVNSSMNTFLPPSCYAKWRTSFDYIHWEFTLSAPSSLYFLGHNT